MNSEKFEHPDAGLMADDDMQDLHSASERRGMGKHPKYLGLSFVRTLESRDVISDRGIVHRMQLGNWQKVNSTIPTRQRQDISAVANILPHGVSFFKPPRSGQRVEMLQKASLPTSHPAIPGLGKPKERHVNA